ncbi:hypothetical protein ACROYT_G003778 [Oculina patagonica]
MWYRRLVLTVWLAMICCVGGWQDFGSVSRLQPYGRPFKLNSLRDSLPNTQPRARRESSRRRPRGKYKYNLKRTAIRDATNRNALCLDGSEAVFYLSRNPESKHWVVQLQAGGSCGTYDSCLDRSKGSFGSSKNYSDFMTGTFVASDDPAENPMFSSWNKVFVPYCSGDVFVGRRGKNKNGHGMNMFGHFIVKAVFLQLIEDYRINRSGTKILFGGASSGGLGMLANIDFIQELVKPAEIRGYNDGGWFTLYPNFGETANAGPPYFFKVLSYMFHTLWGGFVDESCRANMPKAEACLYGELVFKYLSAPVYVFVAQWDSYQLQELVHSKFPTMRLPPELPSEAEYLGKFGKNTHRSLRRVINSKKDGVFSPACFMHAFSGADNVTNSDQTLACEIGGKTPYKAFSEWFISNGTRGTYVEEPLDKPECNPSCCSKLCLKCRKPKPTVAYDEPTEMIVGNGAVRWQQTTLITWALPFLIYSFVYWKDVVLL